MAMQKPVIVTDCKPLKRIVEECRCGFVIPSDDSEKLADIVIAIFDNEKNAIELGRNGREAVVLSWYTRFFKAI